jgi:uncharacterized repeat protein (TIGR02543 family)
MKSPRVIYLTILSLLLQFVLVSLSAEESSAAVNINNGVTYLDSSDAGTGGKAGNQVAMTSEGNLYLLCFGGIHPIVSICKQSPKADAAAPSAAIYYRGDQAIRITNPYGMGLDNNEVLFVSDQNAILRITSSSAATVYESSTAWSTCGGGATAASIRQFTFDSDGNMYVAAGNCGVWKVPTNGINGATTNTGGTPTRVFLNNTINTDTYCLFASSVAHDSAGNLFVSCANGIDYASGDRIVKLTLSGGAFTDSLYKTIGMYTRPNGIALDSQDTVYILAGADNGKVRKYVENAGSITEFQSTYNFRFEANSMTFDRLGNAYVGWDNYIIKMIGLGTPFPPTGLAASAGNGRVALSWRNLGLAGIDTFTVTSSPGGSTCSTRSTDANPYSCTISGLTNAQSYSFSITSSNATGTSRTSSAVIATPVGPPSAPTIGAATLVDSRTASITFTPPASDGGSAITGYTVTSYPHGRTGTGASSPIQVTGLTFGSPETFTVTATNAIGTSDSSTASNIVTPNDVYSVTFDSQGGSSISSGTFVSGGAVAAPGSTPTKSGYSFNGWFAASAGGASLTFPYSPGVTSSITLYAQWTAVSTTPAPVVLGPPPSSFVVVANPKISRSTASLVCTSGSYKFKKQGGREEESQISAQLISLLSNGSVVDSEKTLGAQASFDLQSSYKGTTMSCEVGIQQEEVVETYSSIDRGVVASLKAAMTTAIYQANTSYYEDRRAAYEKRDAGDVKLWKELLERAPIKREATKVQAGVDYIANLEKAGISILVAVDKVAPAPAPAPTKSPEPVVTVNVQPIAMKKVGTIYFASGTYFINAESKKTIKALATSILLKSPTIVLSYGHTDSKGGTDNTVLSQNRAKAVAKLLRSLLPGQKIVTGWYGSSKPAATGTSKAALAKNRRVEIYIK